MSFTKCSLSNVVRTCFCAVALAITASASQVIAQGVGINTTTPDPSAALEIKASDKGILIPQVQLQSLIDQFTIPAPAHGLLVYHIGNNLGGKGFFYNSGLSNGPVWKRVGELTYPYYHGGSEDVLFNLENYKQNSTTIRAYSISGNALEVAGGLKIAGPGQSPGLGKVLTSDAQGNAKWEGEIAFRAGGIVNGGSEKMTINSNTKIPFAIEFYDVGNNYNEADGNPHSTFIVPVSGIYHFSAHVYSYFDQNSDQGNASSGLILVKNSGGVEKNLASSYSTNAPITLGCTLNIATDVSLSAGDQVYLKFTYSGNPQTPSYQLLQTNAELSGFTGRLVMRR